MPQNVQWCFSPYQQPRRRLDEDLRTDPPAQAGVVQRAKVLVEGWDGELVEIQGAVIAYRLLRAGGERVDVGRQRLLSVTAEDGVEPGVARQHRVPHRSLHRRAAEDDARLGRLVFDARGEAQRSVELLEDDREADDVVGPPVDRLRPAIDEGVAASPESLQVQGLEAAGRARVAEVAPHGGGIAGAGRDAGVREQPLGDVVQPRVFGADDLVGGEAHIARGGDVQGEDVDAVAARAEAAAQRGDGERRHARVVHGHDEQGHAARRARRRPGGIDPRGA